MNKDKVLKLLDLLDDDDFVLELNTYFNEKSNIKKTDLSAILKLDDEKIDNILSTRDLKQKVYKFYMYVYDRSFDMNEKTKLVNSLNHENVPSFFLEYLKNFQSSYYSYIDDNLLRVFKKVCDDKVFQEYAKEILSNESLQHDQKGKILEYLDSAVLQKSINVVLDILRNCCFSERNDIDSIIRVITECKTEENINTINILMDEIAEQLEQGVDKKYNANYDNICSRLPQSLECIANTSVFNAKELAYILYIPRVRYGCLVYDIVDSIAKIEDPRIVIRVSSIVQNEKLQETGKLHDYVRIMSESEGFKQAEYGKELLESLVADEVISDYNIDLLLKGVTTAADEKISLCALKAALDKDLRNNSKYEDIVFSIGHNNSDYELASKGFQTACNEHLVDRKDLLKLVNDIGTDGDKENKMRAFKIVKCPAFYDDVHFEDMVSSVAHSFTNEQSQLAFNYAMDDDNKDYKYVGLITSLIGKARTFLQSKTIADLGRNEKIKALGENGLDIVYDVFDAKSAEEVYFILHDKYDVANLDDFVRIANIFGQENLDEIKSCLIQLPDGVDINGSTILVRRKRKN